MKKNYSRPTATCMCFETEGMLAGSALTAPSDNQSVTIGDGEHEGSFRSAGRGWNSADWTDGE